MIRSGDQVVDLVLDPKKRRVIEVGIAGDGRFVERIYTRSPTGRMVTKHKFISGWGPKTLTIRYIKSEQR